MDFRQVLPVPGLRGFRHLECRFLAGASGAWAAGFPAAHTPGRKTGLPPMAKLLFLSIAHFPSVDKQIREQAGTVYGSFHTKKLSSQVKIWKFARRNFRTNRVY